MEHNTSAPNERVLSTAQLAKLSFNHPSVVLTADVFQYFEVFFYTSKELKNVSCENDRLNGRSSTSQAAWYIRHVRLRCFLRTKPTI